MKNFDYKCRQYIGTFGKVTVGRTKGSRYDMSIEKKQVIIVGAGISGLKAASDLYRNGIRDILVLEARNRIGGRLLTLKTPEGNTYDLGASWFHDTLSNPLFQKYVLNQNHTQIHYDDIQTEIYGYSDVDERGFSVPSSWGLEPVKEEMEKYIEMENFSDLNAEDTTLFNTLIDYVYLRRKVLTSNQIKYAPELLRYLELWHGVSWKMMSSKYSVNDQEGRNALNLDGYSKILQDILSSIPEDVIKTGIQVKEILKIDDNSKVKITTVTQESIVADYVIVTVPQSILALPTTDEGSITFSPRLPPYISEPLTKMHFSALGKVVLEFKDTSEIFWNPDTDKFIVLAKPDEVFSKFADNVVKLSEVYKPDSDLNILPFDLHDAYYDFKNNPHNIPKYHQHPILFLNYYTSKKVPTLVALVQSPVTNYLENASLEEAWEFLKPALFILASQKPRSHHSKPPKSPAATARNGAYSTTRIKTPNDLPIPKNIFKSNWTRDPFSRGSYAGCAPGDDPTDLIIGLSKGSGHLRFAGEHTIFDGAGCAHGAWLSGKREANYVLKEYGALKEENTYIEED